MAKIVFQGVPDFTAVRAEIAKLKQEVASVSSTKVNLNGTAQGLNGAANAAGKLAQNLQKVSTTFDANGQATRKVQDFSERLGETTRVVATLNKKSGELTVTQRTVTENYRQQAQAAEKAAAAELKATRQANAYLQQQTRAAQNSPYNPTTLQRQIEGMVGIGNAAKSAADSAGAFERARSNIQTKYGQSQGLFSGNAESAKEYIKTLDGLQNAQVKATGIVQDSAGTFQTFRASVKNADGTAQNFKIAIDQATGEVHCLNEGVAESTEKNGLLGDSFTNVYLKMLQWQVMGTIVSKTIGAFRDAISTMKAVDDEMVTVRKVTGFTAEQMEELRDRAYETASAYGEAADEYLNSVAAFARAGYGEQADALAELATKTKLVGDTNAETAQQFLLSVDAAYKYKGNIDALTKVLDGANEIDNKYTASIEKLAEGLGTVAPIAAQAHVGIDELTAAIGTITAVTQRSGSEAARAFRALVLNIVGDTKTEIDEGVTWTTGEIAGLRDVIRQYAPAAYEAAKATGEVIDPMEAIGGLAQSMKDGLLTEQKLMEMVSDIGGKLRTSQLLALIQNWDMYQSMLKDYANAVGSADKEISNAMDSWTRKTNILKNEWTEFIQSMVSADAVKGGLDVLIGTVEILNTDLGHAVVTAGAVSLGLIGIQAAAKGTAAAFTKLSAAGIAMNPWIVAIGLAAGAFSLVWEATEDSRKSLDALNTEIESSSTKLEENKKRLDEINATNWADLTPEILSERDALETENAELERQIQKYKDLAEVKGSHVNNNGTISVLGYQAKASETVSEARRTEGTAGADTGLRTWTQSAATAKEAIDAATASLENAYQVMDGTIAATTKRTQVTLEGADAYNYLKSAANDLITTLDTEHALTADEVLTYNDLIKVMPKYINYLAENGEQTGELKQLLDLLTAAYSNAAEAAKETADATASAGDKAGTAAGKYGSLAEMVDEVSARYNVLKTAQDETNQTGVVSANTLSTMLTKYPELMGYLEQTKDGYKLTKGALEDYIEAQETECRVALADAKSAAESVLTQEVQKALGYDMTTEAIYEQIKAMQALAGTAGHDQLSGYRRTLRMKGVPESQIDALFGGVSDFDAMKKMEERLAALGNIKVGSVSTSKSSTGKSEKDAELERLKDIVSLRKSELSLMQERGDSTADQIDKMRQIQAALHAQAEYMRRIGASQSDINALSTEHWKITKQIKELQEDLWDELEDAVNKKLEEAEETRDKQTAAIDKQIAALKDAKEAEDESLKLEELKAAVLEKQNALLEAQKERTVRVFNAATRQWEWEANASSVKSAQDAYDKAKEDLAEYERELALQREIDELEARKTLIEETYNTLKAEWKRITDSLQSPTRTIDDILSDIARNGTPKMRQQVEKVNTLLGKLNQYIAGTVNGGQIPGQPGEVPGTAGANGSTGGYYFDFNKNPGGGWTQTEMDEGFKNSGSSSSSSGWQLADGSSANLNYKDTTPVGNGTKLQYKGPDMSRDPKLAGKTVEKNGYVITYDENGYAKSAINAHQGAAGSKLSGKYPQVDADGNKMHYTGFNKDIDYSLAIKQAKKAGLGEGAIKQLETERQNKINALYGGKDPAKKYDSGGVLKGLGGIKATSRDEIVIPPLLAEKMLEPSADSTFQKRMGELGWLYGAAERGSAMPGKTVMSRTSYDHYGDSYSVNGVQIGAEAANRLTIAQVMQALNHGAGNLGLYKH